MSIAPFTEKQVEGINEAARQEIARCKATGELVELQIISGHWGLYPQDILDAAKQHNREVQKRRTTD